jgi:hypothetical protein
MDRYTTIYSPLSALPAINSVTGRYESALSVDVVDLPRKTGGIISVSAPTTTTTVYVPVSFDEGNQLYGSESSLTGTVVGYSFTGPRTIEYWGMSAAEAAADVVIRLIKQFKSYDNTDNVLMPYGQDQRVLDLVREFLGATPPKDLINDNADIKANG